jgi:hypothetical protein
MSEIPRDGSMHSSNEQGMKELEGWLTKLEEVASRPRIERLTAKPDIPREPGECITSLNELGTEIAAKTISRTATDQ